MKKILFFVSLIFVFLFVNAQKQENVLFAYNSSENAFSKVIEYCVILNVEVIEYCEAERLIFVNLNNQFEEYAEFFDELGKAFDGTFLYKSDTNEILTYLKCQNREMQEIMLNEKAKKDRQ